MQTDEKSKESVLNNFVFQNQSSQQVHFFKDEYRNLCYQRRKKKEKKRLRQQPVVDAVFDKLTTFALTTAGQL